MTKSQLAKCYYTVWHYECHNAELYSLSLIMLNVIRLSLIMLIFLWLGLIVILLSVVRLVVMLLNAVAP